jgi:hypothetical protein
MSDCDDVSDEPTDRDDHAARTNGSGGPAVHEQRLYEPDRGPELVTVIIETVAAVEGVEPTAITNPVLYREVDIESVKDALFGADYHGDRGLNDVSVSFDYRGFRVTIRSDGWVQVADQPAG